MVEGKESGFIGLIKEILCFIPQLISVSIVSPIAERTEKMMNYIEGRIVQIEKRIIKSITSMFVIGLGVVFLSFALFYFLIDLGWSNAAAYGLIGIIILGLGLLLKARGMEM